MILFQSLSPCLSLLNASPEVLHILCYFFARFRSAEFFLLVVFVLTLTFAFLPLFLYFLLRLGLQLLDQERF